MNQPREDYCLNDGSTVEYFGAGDSRLYLNFISEQPLSVATLLRRIVDEVGWIQVQHKQLDIPRLVAIQGTIYENLYYPVYRLPADNQPALKPWTENVYNIKSNIEKYLGCEMNHCLIQYYRSSRDYISEHNDKTLDICKGSVIVNYSVGATRSLSLISKNTSCPERTQIIPLHHNSLFVLGLNTNREYKHSIEPDHRPNDMNNTDE